MNSNLTNTKVSKVSIGIDTNITAIGFSYTLFDENGRAINSNLQTIKLDSSNADSYNRGVSYETPASTRRANRSVRHNRRHKRIVQNRLVKLLNTIGLRYNESFYTSNMMQLKIDGLSRPLTQDEFSSIIFSYTKNRGYFELDEVEQDEKDKDYKKNIQNFTTNILTSGLTISQYVVQNNIKLHDGFHIPLSVVYKEELSRIWKHQITYPQYQHLTNYLSKIFKLIWFRFDGKSYRNLIGECKLETNVVDSVLRGRKVCSSAHPTYESFSTWATIHNLRFTVNDNKEQQLSNSTKSEIYNFSLFNEKIELDELKRIIVDNEFSFDNGDICLKNSGEIIGKYTVSKDLNWLECLNTINFDINRDKEIKFGKFTVFTHEILLKYGVLNKDLNVDTSKLASKWVSNSNNNINRYPSKFYNTHYRKLMYDLFYIITSNQSLGSVKLGLKNIIDNDNLCDELTKISFNKDKGKLSLKAIDKMIPYMNGDIDYISEYDAKVKIYGDSTENRINIAFDKPITSRDTRNYMIADAANQVMRYLKAVIELYGDDVNYDIKIELGRNVCANKDTRKSITDSQRRNEKLNEIYARVINEYNKKYKKDYVKVNFKNMLRVKLFIEQIESLSFQTVKLELHKLDETKLNEIIDGIIECKLKASVIYNDIKFDIVELFSEDFEVEHTLTKSLYHSDDNLGLTICDKNTNTLKGSRTGFDYISTLPLEEQQSIKNRLDKLYPKITVKSNKKFLVKKNLKREYFNISEDGLYDFIMTKNQLTINSYMAKFIADRLRLVYNGDNVKFYFSNGMITNTLKNELRLNTFFNEFILETLTYDYKFKPDLKFDTAEISKQINKRFDDRHHALDAFIISLVNNKYLHNINNVHNADTEEENIKTRQGIVNGIMKSFGLPNVTKDKKELVGLHDIVKTYLQKCVVVSGNKYNEVKFKKEVKDKNGVVHKCDGVVGEIHQQTLYGFDKKNNAYSTRDSFDSLYVQKGDNKTKKKDVTFNGKKVKIITIDINGTEYLVMDNNRIKTLLKNQYRAFKMINANTFIFQNQQYNLHNYIGQTKVGDKEVYYDIKFLDTFYDDKSKPNTLKTNRISSLVVLSKDAMVEQIRLDGNGVPVYAFCPNKSHISVFKGTDGKYKSKTISINSMLKNVSDNLNDSDELVVKIKKNDMFIVGSNKEEILDRLSSNDYSIYNDLFYVNGFDEKGSITMLKHSISGILGSIKNVLLSVDNTGSVSKNKTHLNGVSKITINTDNLKRLKCISKVKFNTLGEIDKENIESYTFQ